MNSTEPETPAETEKSESAGATRQTISKSSAWDAPIVVAEVATAEAVSDDSSLPVHSVNN